MKKREEALKDLEEEYEQLKEQHEITQENYEKARERLEEAKKQMVKDIIEADKAHQERLKEIEKEFKNKSADDLMRMTEELLGK
jgi:septation ring formation regulator EzrA